MKLAKKDGEPGSGAPARRAAARGSALTDR
jgi:hypothetical protein